MDIKTTRQTFGARICNDLAVLGVTRVRMVVMGFTLRTGTVDTTWKGEHARGAVLTWNLAVLEMTTDAWVAMSAIGDTLRLLLRHVSWYLVAHGLTLCWKRTRWRCLRCNIVNRRLQELNVLVGIQAIRQRKLRG